MHEVIWTRSDDTGAQVLVKLAADAFGGSGRQFLLALDDAIDELEDIFHKEYKGRTGKTL